MTVLNSTLSVKPTGDVAAMAARIAQLEADLAKKNKITYKVSEKGAVSVYGLNARFPVTLYLQQWERLLNDVPALVAFIAANKDRLSVKQAA